MFLEYLIPWALKLLKRRGPRGSRTGTAVNVSVRGRNRVQVTVTHDEDEPRPGVTRKR